MIIHRLEIKNVRGIKHLVLDDLPEEGIVLITGENESGKSSIQDAFRALINDFHGSAKKDVKSLQSRSPGLEQESPEMALDATMGEYRVQLKKKFLRGASSQLTITPLDGGPARTATGRDSDDQFKELLEKHTDENLREALFVRQEDVANQIAASGILCVTQALAAQSQVAPDADSEDLKLAFSDELMQRVTEEYKKYYTAKTGAENSTFKGYRKKLEDAIDHRIKCENQVKSLDNALRVIEKNEPAIQDLIAGKPDLEARRKELEEAVQKCAAVAAEAEKAKEKFTQRSADFQRAKKDLDDRLALKQDLEKREEALQAKQAELEKLNEDSEKFLAQQQALEKALSEAKDKATQADDKLRQARRNNHRAELVVRHADLHSVVTKANDLDTQRKNLKVPATQIEAEDLDALTEAQQNLSIQQHYHAMSSARLDIRGPQGSSVRVDGEERELLEENIEVLLREGTSVELGDFHLTYRAGRDKDGNALGDSREELEKAERSFADLLEKYGVSDLAGAREAHRAYRDYQDQSSSLDQRIKDILPAGSTLDELSQELAQLAAQLSEGEDLAGAHLDLDKARALRNQASQELEEADKAAEEAIQGREDAQKALDDLMASSEQEARVRAQAEVDTLSSAFEEEQERAALKEKETPLSQLEENSKDAALAMEAAKTLWEEAEKQRDAADLTGTSEQLKAAENKLKNRQHRQEKLEEQLYEARGVISTGEGDQEVLDAARVEEDCARAALEDIEAKASAVNLLYEVLTKHYGQARDAYAAPFQARFNELARLVFGKDVDFHLDQELMAAERTLNNTTFEIAQLSGGAKEQIALLERLTVAMLIEEKDRVPMFIDDALGNTDAQRLESMALALNKVGEKRQIFVLTCFPERFDAVSAEKTVNMGDVSRIG